MKFMIAVDCEGVACASGQPGKTISESKEFGFVKKQATREANAAAKALFENGATKVIIWDNHNGSLNLDYDMLDERCEILLGTGGTHRWHILDNTFSGVLLIGYHPMDNTIDGILAHTFSSTHYQWMKINGVEVGEIEIDAAMAGEKKVPLIFVSSDDKGVKEAKRFMPWVETNVTKIGLGRHLALSKHPKQVEKEIFENVESAVKRLDKMKPFTFRTPITYQIRFKRLEEAERMVRNRLYKRLAGFTLERKAKKLSDIY